MELKFCLLYILGGMEMNPIVQEDEDGEFPSKL